MLLHPGEGLTDYGRPSAAAYPDCQSSFCTGVRGNTFSTTNQDLPRLRREGGSLRQARRGRGVVHDRFCLLLPPPPRAKRRDHSFLTFDDYVGLRRSDDYRIVGQRRLHHVRPGRS